MTRKRLRSRRSAAVLTGNLMLTPAVIAMRLPLLAAEAMALDPWRVETVRAVTEKTAAAMEGAVAAQMSLAWSVARFWQSAFAGRAAIRPDAAMERAVHAALKPASRRVKSNYRRLSRR